MVGKWGPSLGILVHPAKQKHNELKTVARHGAAAAARPTERVGGRCRQMMARRIATIQLHLDQVEREPRKEWKAVKRRPKWILHCKVNPPVNPCTFRVRRSNLNGLIDLYKRTPTPFNTI